MEASSLNSMGSGTRENYPSWVIYLSLVKFVPLWAYMWVYYLY